MQDLPSQLLEWRAERDFSLAKIEMVELAISRRSDKSKQEDCKLFGAEALFALQVCTVPSTVRPQS